MHQAVAAATLPSHAESNGSFKLLARRLHQVNGKTSRTTTATCKASSYRNRWSTTSESEIATGAKL